MGMPVPSVAPLASEEIMFLDEAGVVEAEAVDEDPDILIIE